MRRPEDPNYLPGLDIPPFRLTTLSFVLAPTYNYHQALKINLEFFVNCPNMQIILDPWLKLRKIAIIKKNSFYLIKL